MAMRALLATYTAMLWCKPVWFKGRFQVIIKLISSEWCNTWRLSNVSIKIVEYTYIDTLAWVKDEKIECEHSTT